MAVLRCVSLVAAVACLLLLLPAPTVARRTLGVVNDGDAHSASAAEVSRTRVLRVASCAVI